ncbi:hypothetical protein [Enterobacter hormaechei]|nr:hypothetical protein [Enterobacter hormaechei]
MDALQNLVVACQADETLLRQQAQSRMESWQRSDESPNDFGKNH